VRVERDVEIDRPIEQVFDYVADARNDPRWCPKVLSCDQIEGDGPGAAARYRARHRPSRLKPGAELEIQVTAYERPRRLRWREEDEDGVFDVTYELEPTAEGTRFTQRSEIDWKLSRLLRPMAARMVPRHVDEQLSELKRVLESR